jgi:HK97 family phage prohead protease
VITVDEAAQQRAQGVRALKDRPSQRRAFENGPLGFTRGLSTQTQLRESSSGSGLLHFTGHATVYERGYEMWDYWGPYTEIVSAGAARSSLARGDLSVPLVLDHEPLRRIAITDNGSLSLSEDDIGLHVDAPSLNPKDHDVAYIAVKFADDLRFEMSFRFRIIRGQWSPDYTEYRIDEFDIHRGDVAIVGYGANPHTTDSELRDAPEIVRALRGTDLIHDFDTQLRSVPA